MNYKIEISYDGTRYAGWQKQNNAKTIQGEIENALEILLKEKINLIGSGRTDAGAHALRQIANFKLEKKIENFKKFLYAANSILPRDISINFIDEVGEDFHARYSAKRRIYYYLIAKRKNPFFDKYSLLIRENLSVDYLNLISTKFLGKKDFEAFSSKDCWTDNRVCEVFSANWRENKDLFLFRIESNRFLRGMIRAIVGTTLFVHKNQIDADIIDKYFESKNRQMAPFSVPAKGLLLFKVVY
jgi:tRNA pseudouridine38-40 synthase